jgi:hypothetical protein
MVQYIKKGFLRADTAHSAVLFGMQVSISELQKHRRALVATLGHISEP